MPRDARGNYTLPEAPFVAGTKIKTGPVNANFTDLAEALTGSLPRDGSVPVSGDLEVTGRVVAREARLSGQVRSEASNAFRAVTGGRGVILRNDGAACYLLQTAEGDPDGSWDALRPLAWNLSTGALTLDGTGAGASFGGPVGVAGELAVGGSLKCGGGGSFAANPAPANGGYQKLPSGVILQWGAGTTNRYGGLSFAWPVAFPNAFRAMTALAWWGAPRAVCATQGICDRGQGTVWLTYGEGTAAIGVDFSYLAVGF